MNGLNKFLKQAAKMQQQLQAMQAELSKQLVEASTGGGAVKVVASCDERIISVEIDPALLKPEEREMLQDLILTAVNSALDKARQTVKQQLSKITGGLQLPGMGF